MTTIVDVKWKKCILIPLLLVGFACQKEMKIFSEPVWNEFDIRYSHKRYAMTLWLFENYDFSNKTKKDIYSKFYNRYINKIADELLAKEEFFSEDVKEISFIVKYHREKFLFFSYADEYSEIPIAYLIIKFDGDKVSKVILKEADNRNDKFKIVKRIEF